MTEGFPRKFGKYHLLAPLAQGGMGALYLSVTGAEELEKLVVIKTVLPHLADAEYVQRFKDEAKVVVKLSHGNLVPVFDAGEVNGEIFLAMEYIQGKDLRAVWNRCAKKAVAFPIDVAVHIVKELARGLAYAHSFGNLKLVHRDVSPPNVLTSFHGEVKLTDFGLASSTLKLEKTAPGVIYGKVSYMSPEQARGEPLDGRTDLYAAGIILWELLTGRQLFPPGQAQPSDLLARAKDPHPDPPSKRASRVPKALDEIVLTALASDPAKRYQNGNEMRAALTGWLAKEAPGTDSAKLEQFVRQLFAEDIDKERAERETLVAKARQALKEGPKHPRPATPLPVSGVHNLNAAKMRAVSVPAPGPGGQTVRADTSGLLAAAALAEDEDVEPTSSLNVLGQVIDGRYHVRSLIGEGGMGRVYEAEHIEIGKRVALKILHPAYSRTPEVVARFRREARAASKIGHPNIVDVTDSGTTADGSVYFVMEFLEGVELADVIDREGALDIGRTLNIGTQICRALAAAHNAGIVHRDLKPENVFLVVREGTTDFVKVLDFGIAKSAELEERKERLTHPGMAMGTPEYMAPEQAAGKPADPRSDIYAVGAILYEMLTGAPPYDGENFMEILTKKATLEPRPVRDLRPDVAETVERVVMRALSREPNDRPQSMEGFEYELTKCLAGRGVAVAKMLGMPVDPMVAGVADPMAMGTSGPVFDTGVRANPLLGFHTTGNRPNPLLASGTAPAASPQMVAPAPMFGVTNPLEPDKAIPSGGGALWAGLSGSIPSLKTTTHLPTLIGFGALVAVFAALGWWLTSQEPQGTYREHEPSASVRPADERPDADLTKKRDEEKKAPEKEKAAPDKDPKAPEKGEAPDRPAPAPEKKVNVMPPPATPERTDVPAEPGVPGAPPPASKHEAEQLLVDARAAEVQHKLVPARTLYDRVARGKFERGRGLIGLARVAFEARDFTLAADLAQKAIDAGAPFDSRVILGDALYRQGLYDEAAAQYQLFLKRYKTNRIVRQKLAEAQRMALKQKKPKRGG